MKRINPSDLETFARHYRFPGGRLARIKYIHRGGQLDIEIVLVARTAVKDLNQDAKKARLRLRFVDVEECRFQKRPGTSLATLKDLKLGFFDGSIFANFDSWALGPGERPALHDFRGSEAYIGCKDLLWEPVERSAA